MPPELIDQEEDYASSEDSDFAPEDAAEQHSSPSSDDEDEDASKGDGRKSAPRKRQRANEAGVEVEDAGFENSGDEAVIGKGKKRLKKEAKEKRRDGDVEGESGGEGGLIKTRSMRAQEKAERKAAGPTGPVTIDAEAIWAQVTGAAPGPPEPAEERGTATAADDIDGAQATAQPPAAADVADGSTSNKPADPPEMIRIKRTYNFAGKIHTEEKLVSRDSAEAKLYLASLGPDASSASMDSSPTRAPRKAFRSVFEPVIGDRASLRRTDLDLGMRPRAAAAAAAGARKLNTVEKSRMDWAGYVDKEGIKDELELAGKSKGSFVARQDFLARSEARREEEARRARLAGRV